MCEGYFKRLCREAGLEGVEARSAGVFAGTGAPASPSAIAAASAYGADISGHRSAQMDKPMIEEADLILAMTSGHRMHIGAICPAALAKTKLLMDYADQSGADVADPFGGDTAAYSSCFEEMKPALENLFLEILGKIRPKGDEAKKSMKRKQ